ncbi:hypothetical protein CCR75_008188 [Bremia lactucae]|uniref:Glutamate carboxypeptidase n=1 Tax=Bremia lactucae TaxID=4779 RepID=A0A976ILH9_BRELC|nr:hypothetical protein CCR75_008188 [Bremia lactucae]
MEEAYGTFRGSVLPYEREQTRIPKKSWHFLCLVTFLLVLATYMLLPSRYDSKNAATLISTPEKSLNVAEELITLRKKQHSSGGLSKRETSFLNTIDTTEIRKFHGAYASVPHPAGSRQDYQTALFTAEQFKSFGLKTEIVEYYPLLSLPIHRKVSIVAPLDAKRHLNLTEETIVGDLCTNNTDALPPYFGYSDSGNVTAPVVYVNYARPCDFQWLKAQNITLRGKIALVRYGGNFRGLKVMLAEEHGMVGVLIYSDPFDDGYTQGFVYPKGPWRPKGSFQRGSVQFNSIAGGDPLTPGFPSLPGQPYLSLNESQTIPHLPALPLSYGQARFILESLGGKKAPTSWQGALSLKTRGYYIGDDEATVLNVDVAMDNHIGPIWNVLGTIQGTEEPEQMVIIGNHRDAWVCGAVDPSSGSAVMLEVAHGFGKLLQEGWQPRRTLVLASWDGEELGLLGSTEFAEDHATFLKKQAVAYLNVDNLVGSFVSVGGTPSIARLLQDTAQLLPGNAFHGTPVTETLYEQWVRQTAARRASLTIGMEDGTLGPDHLIQLLGTGKDFTAFYQHLGIISADLGYTMGSAMYGTYHSSMDSLRYVETVGDPYYATHTNVAKWWGLLTLRLIDETIVPFDYSTYGLVMQESFVKYARNLTEMGRIVDLSNLQRAIEVFQSKTEMFQAHIKAFTRQRVEKKKDNQQYEATRRRLNEKLVTLERYLIAESGLPHRPWFKHLIFGPGFYEGYKGIAFPGISDCIVFKDDSATIQAHVDDVAAVIETASSYLMSK